MYKIGEFSKLVGITVKALRYYDDIGLLKPAQINEENAYRYYDSHNFHRALYIKTLKKYDFTIKEIQDVIHNIHSDDDLADFLLEKKQHIEDKIRSMKQLQKDINRELLILKEVNEVEKTNLVEIVELPAIKVASIRYKGKYVEVGKYLGQLYKSVGMKGLSAPFSIYYDDSYVEENADVEVCVQVKDSVNKGQVKTRTLSGGRFVSITHLGPYETLSKSYKALADYMADHKLEGVSPIREIYEKGPGMLFKGNQDKYQTKILMQIKE